MDQAHYEELSRLLIADIQALVPLTFPYRQPVSEAHIRLAGTILRRWLIDGDLQKLLSETRSSAQFAAQGNTIAKKYCDDCKPFKYYLTAGIMADGRPIRHIYSSDQVPDKINPDFMKQGEIYLPLKKFVNQPVLFFDGNWFTRAAILRFVANKLGGNHIDFNRDGDDAKLNLANSFICYGGPQINLLPKGCETYIIIEPQSPEILGGVHLETLACAASFAQMKINGVQLCTLQSQRSIGGWLRKIFDRKPKRFMVGQNKI